MANQDIVRFGDTFYLKHESSKQYLVNVNSSRRNWPQLSNTGHVELKIDGGEGEVTSNSYIKIKTTEQAVFNNDTLGAFADSHNCYYWKDGYDDGKQGWRITKASGNAGPIFYGERVHITNISYHNQRLALDTKYQGYITTVENAGDSWILEPAKATPSSDVQPSSPKSSDIFSWSVASGDPTTTGVILWTRVNPKDYDDTTSLKYQVTNKDDSGFNSVVLEDEVKASQFNSEKDHTVHVDLNGKLKPNQSYLYRFIYKNVYSPIGHCKTLPDANTELNKLSLAVLTCNDYSTGYFNALYKLAEENVDFVIHLGDFIYEYLQYPPGYGDIVRTDLTIKNNKYPHKDPANCDRATSLEHFRHIYQTYRQDPALQKAMENHTWIVALDDHEIADNCYWNYEDNKMDVSVDDPPHPIYENLKDKPKEDARVAMLDLYKNATQAWREYVPSRVQKLNKSEDPRYDLYRKFQFGSLVDFFLTDSRSFRDKPELETNSQILKKVKEYQKSYPIARAIAKARNDLKLPEWKASMLGQNQKNALIGDIEKSNASWRVWGNQTFLATALANEMIGEIDDWHGFKAERYEILQRVKDSETLKNTKELEELNKKTNKTEKDIQKLKFKPDQISRFVVFTGDMHTSLVAYLKTETETLQSDLASGAVDKFQPGVSDVASGASKLASGALNLLSADLGRAATNVGEGALNLGKGALNLGLGALKVGGDALSGIGSGIIHPIETAQNAVETVKNSFNYDYSKLVGVEFMTPSVTSPGISEGILKKLESKLPVDIPKILEKLALFTDNSVHQQQSWQHKFVTGSPIKSLSPHIEHYDSRVNGYAIAEFTADELNWKVYRVDRTDHDKLEGRNVSTARAKKELVQSVKYNPNGIELTDSLG
ncbi:hypothetical protein F7734_06935 [Scytonema sp. UIC 10036]|uniref:alkaline phosphatase D family protein n=1 Tax=Scytonema sp. UIC 10036 TaxID=2304196 RepID=UPI0012DA5554|nr:alkaline phosphatase D family protein [Scytonema sp. UIC 10036]MUG92207.1 hypothetical protein [Scytonema sp. UIC 10036]